MSTTTERVLMSLYVDDVEGDDGWVDFRVVECDRGDGYKYRILYENDVMENAVEQGLFKTEHEALNAFKREYCHLFNIEQKD